MKNCINELFKNPSKFIDKTKVLMFIPKLEYLVDENIINDKQYIQFGKHHSLYGDLNDDIRIYTKERCIGGFCPQSSENNFEIWFFNSEYNEYDFENWSEFKNTVETNATFKNELIDVFSGTA